VETIYFQFTDTIANITAANYNIGCFSGGNSARILNGFSIAKNKSEINSL
jgi:hypothetical protein